ncbi:tetratricopeptide repeat protein [Bizionia paragorgiae]|uniref:tetratricopeptide repeat protein n=1 Tax=Bizionia paragorgiae TaxID=283786 RepID=UPI003A91430A
MIKRLFTLFLISIFIYSCGDGLTYEQKINNYNLYISKADSLIFAEEYTEAVKYANTAIAITDTLSAGFIKKGYASYKLDWLDVAEDNLDEAIDLDGESSIAYKYRALVFLKNGDSDFLDDINIYLENHPNDEGAIELRRNYYEQKNDFDKAIEEYNVALLKYPDSTNLMLKRGELYFKNGSFDQALKDYKSILKLEPENEFVQNKKSELETLMTKKNDRNRFVFLLLGIYAIYVLISFFILRPIVRRKAINQIGGEFKLTIDPLIWAIPIVLTITYFALYFYDLIPKI